MLGSGLLHGLAVTARNLVGSFHDSARYTTVEYPEVKAALPEAYRNFPFLVSETADDPMGTLRCVACQICEKECPPQCIYIEKSKDKKPDYVGKPEALQPYAHESLRQSFEQRIAELTSAALASAENYQREATVDELEDARKAIRQGADYRAVIDRFNAHGINFSAL